MNFPSSSGVQSSSHVQKKYRTDHGPSGRDTSAKQPKNDVRLPEAKKNLSDIKLKLLVAGRELEAATTEWNSLAKQLESLNKALETDSGKDVKSLKKLIRQVSGKIDEAVARSEEATRTINLLTHLRDKAKEEVQRAKDEISKVSVDAITRRAEEHVQQSTDPTVPPAIASGDKPREGINAKAPANTVNQEKRVARPQNQNAGCRQPKRSSKASITRASEAAPHQLIIGTGPSSDQRGGDAQYIRTLALSCLTFGMAGLMLNQRFGVSPSDGDRSFLPSSILLGLAVGEAAETVSGNLDRVSDSLKALWLVLAVILVGMHFGWW